MFFLKKSELLSDFLFIASQKAKFLILSQHRFYVKVFDKQHVLMTSASQKRILLW